MENKLRSMREAIAENVRDGISIVMGTALEALIPFAAGHEIIRQRKRNLTLIGPISDVLFDQLIGAGCVERVIAAWVGNVSAGSGYNIRRAVERSHPRPLELIDHTNFTLALGLHAASLGVPFLPTHTALGSDILRRNPHLKQSYCPFTGQSLSFVAAIKPELAILHVQRADTEGSCHVWGNRGVSSDAAAASERVIIVAEEIVSASVIRREPNLTLVPGFRVTAVVQERWGAHPSPVQGYYGRDHEYFNEYHRATASEDGFREWCTRWVAGVENRDSYINLLSEHRRRKLLQTGGASPFASHA